MHFLLKYCNQICLTPFINGLEAKLRFLFNKRDGTFFLHKLGRIFFFSFTTFYVIFDFRKPRES